MLIGRKFLLENIKTHSLKLNFFRVFKKAFDTFKVINLLFDRLNVL